MAKSNILLGAHMSIRGGLQKAIERGERIGCTAIQIFTKSSRSWSTKKLTLDEINLFKTTLKNSSIKSVVAHSSYLINLASANKEIENKSVKSLSDELDRCEKLGIKYLVMHPGSHVGQGEKEGIEKIAKNLDLVLKKGQGETKIVLETTAGQGTNIGYKFEQIKEIMLLCKAKKRLGVCIDTCHIFSAGYNIGTTSGYNKTMEEFIKKIGQRKLKIIHINDSKTELGSKKDRHENIGKGSIPLKAFDLIMNDKRLEKVPKILETPAKSEEIYENEIKLLRKLVRKK